MNERTHTRLSKWLNGRLWWLLAVPILLLAAYVVAARQLMLLVPDHRLDVQHYLEQRLGVTVHIDRLVGHMNGLTPHFELDGLTLPTQQGEPALRIGKVVVGVRVLPTLLHRQPYLSELRINGIDVQLVRSADGRIHLRGLELLHNPQSDWTDFLQGLYRQQHIVVRNARFSLAWPGLPPLAASSLTLELVNSDHHHSLAVRMAARDRPLTVDARLEIDGNPLDWREVQGRGYLDISGQRLQEWLPEHHQHQWPVDVAALDGRARIWAQVDDGALSSAALQLSSSHTVLTDGHQQWPLSDLGLDASLHRDMHRDSDEGGQITVSGLHVTSPAGALAPGPLSLAWQRHDGHRQWTLGGGKLTLQALSQQLLAWPFALPQAVDAWRPRIKAQAPQGSLEQFYASGTDEKVGLVQARFSALTAKAYDKVPGFSGVDGWLAATPEGGVARLAGASLTLTFPKLYDHSLAATLEPAPLRWRKVDGHWQVDSGIVRVHNKDAYGVALFRLRAGGDVAVPELRLLADLHDGDGKQAAHYIPLRLLKEKSAALGDWLAQAFHGGALDHGQFLYRGPVHTEPGRQHDHTFQMRFQGHGIDLSFLPDWPQARDVSADVLIDGPVLIGHASTGKLFNSELSDVSVTVPEVPDHALSHIVIDGQVSAPAADLDQLFQNTPLKDHLPDELQDWHFSAGQVEGRLKLDLPLAKGGKQPPQVSVDGKADDLTIANPARQLQITQVSGPVRFDLQNGINSDHLQGDALGGHFTGSWSSTARTSRLSLSGAVPVQSLLGWREMDWLNMVSGTLPLELALNLPWHGSPFSLQASSSLKGVKIDAPVPLGKAAGTARPSQMALSFAKGRGSLDFHYGGVGRGHLRLGGTLAGGVRLGPGKAPPDPAQGLDIEGRVPQANAQQWLAFVAGLIPDQQKEAKAGSGGVAQLVHRVVVQADRLDLYSLALKNARFFAVPNSGGWSLGLTSPSLAGTAQLPAGYHARGDKPLTLAIQRLYLPNTLFDKAHSASAHSTSVNGKPPLLATQVPDMNVDIDDLRIGDQHLGHWAARLRPTKEGVSATDLRGQWRHIRVNGRLDWSSDAHGQHSRYYGSLDSDDLGAAFKAWGLPVLIDTHDAHMQANLAWDAWPFAPDYTALQGSAKLDIGECRIPDTNGKASGLRVLGILNIGTLQRRLRLDFSDLYKKGLSCDSIKGDFLFEGPTVSTKNLHIKSPSAAFAIKGQVNLAKQTLDQQVEMTLPISSNLYAGCLAGPAVCAGIFVVERIWGDKLDKTTTMTYQVSGPWKNPQVKETEGMFQ